MKELFKNIILDLQENNCVYKIIIFIIIVVISNYIFDILMNENFNNIQNSTGPYSKTIIRFVFLLLAHNIYLSIKEKLN